MVVSFFEWLGVNGGVVNDMECVGFLGSWQCFDVGEAGVFEVGFISGWGLASQVFCWGLSLETGS